MDLTGLGPIADFAKSIVDRFFPPAMSEEDRTKAAMELQQLLAARENAVMDAQKAIMVAELSQGDNYTKRARPTVVYVGLVFIALVHVVMPMAAWIWLAVKGSPLDTLMPDLKLPHEFWWAWAGICSTWVVGRSFEKSGVRNKLVQTITGGKP